MGSVEKQAESTRTTDRKLGDQWVDWKGIGDRQEPDVDEKKRTFFVLAGINILILIASLCAAWYLVKPRFQQFGLVALFEWLLTIFVLGLSITVLVEAVLLFNYRKSLFPYPWVEKFLLTLITKAIWLGTKFGVNRDRVANSFIKVHNTILRRYMTTTKSQQLLLLLPRCLEKETRRKIIERTSGTRTKIVTAGGGEEARKAIREHCPSLILAVACERDLISGMKEVADRIPVFAIPNKRPEGPCKNTCLPFSEFDDILSFIFNTGGQREPAGKT